MLKVLQGNPGKRRLNDAEPKPPQLAADFDQPPVEVLGDPIAEKEWRRVAPILRQTRMVTEVERGLLVALCQQWSRYLEAHSKVATAGMIIRAASGNPMANPYLTVADRALAHCTKLWVELGLTPSSRSRLSVPKADPTPTKWAGLL
jgi:P27 family predicted phage terminase small subunit